MSRKLHGRALVVGVPRRLQGAERDVHAVAAMLDERGFAVDVCYGNRATRAGILDAYDQLIAEIHCDEPAVFYFTGHGFAGIDRETRRQCKGISPIDLDDGGDDDFHGISSWELSIKQTQLTRRTPNVTTILDCCYASQMSRTVAAHRAVSRALPNPVRRSFTAHFAALRAMYGELWCAAENRGNPHAVRLVACGPQETAHESPDADGQYHGVFTSVLLDVLREVRDAPVTWAAIYGEIRGRVLRRFPNQRPDLEGPRNRRLFSLQTGRAEAVQTVEALEDGLFQLGVGRLTGVAVDDIYGVMPPGEPTYREAHAVAELRVYEAFATLSHATLVAWKNGHRALPHNAFAMLTRKVHVRHAVKLAAPDDERSTVARELEATGMLRLAEPDENTVLPMLRLDRGALTLEDAIGPLFPAAAFPHGLSAAVANLANFSAAHAIRALEGEHGLGADDLDIEWGSVDRDQLRPMPALGGALALRDRVYVKITSKAERELHVHIFNLGLRGKIASLVNGSVVLPPGSPPFVLGQDIEGKVAGRTISWPHDMPRGKVPRTDEIVVIVTVLPTDMAALEAPEHRMRALGPSRIAALLARLQETRARGARGMESIDHFLVKRLRYALHPIEAAMADRPFLVDDNPLRQRAMQHPRTWTAPADDPPAGTSQPCPIAIRIAKLVVESGQLPATVLRVDALVCTRSRTDAPGWSTWTQRHALAAGEPLSLHNCVIHRGPVVDFVEVYLWVSAAPGDSPALDELLVAHPDHASAVAALEIPDSSAVPRIAAVSASMVLSRLTYDILAAGAPIGISRMSFVAGEDFATDRSHRREAYHRDVAITLVVEPVESDRSEG